MMFTREQLTAIATSQPEVLVEIIMALQEQVQSLLKRVEELEQKLKKNSRNSNNPPASDGLAKPKPKSLRKPSGKKSGGQKGHTGHTLEQVEQPDHILNIPVTSCLCHADLSHEPVTGYECRQVFELPEPKLEVTEYRGEIKTCPQCKAAVSASFPDMVNAPVQYGPKFRGMLVYLHNQQFIPFNRINQMMVDLYGAPVSEATILDASCRSHGNLAPFENAAINALVHSKIIHVDESGVRTAGKLHWLHSVSSQDLTFYGIHEKRGTEAMDHFTILPNFQGRLIHDFWKPYLTYNCTHGLCNAHHLRELTFLFEQQDQPWAKKMFYLLLEMNRFVGKQNEQLTPEQKDPWLRQYRGIIAEGWATNPLPQNPLKKKRGRPPKTKSQNLLLRLGDHESSALAFLHDRNVPFTNNLAEQDIRMIKVRQKISGCFRTLQGAKHFARIRSYISTARKQKRNIIESLTAAITGKAFLPALSN